MYNTFAYHTLWNSTIHIARKALSVSDYDDPNYASSRSKTASILGIVICALYEIVSDVVTGKCHAGCCRAAGT